MNRGKFVGPLGYLKVKVRYPLPFVGVMIATGVCQFLLLELMKKPFALFILLSKSGMFTAHIVIPATESLFGLGKPQADLTPKQCSIFSARFYLPGELINFKRPLQPLKRPTRIARLYAPAVISQPQSRTPETHKSFLGSAITVIGLFPSPKLSKSQNDSYIYYKYAQHVGGRNQTC